ncbi:MAG: hypothetical protein EAZ33_06490 [Oscillatoriales cyanobacterium]|nr:MAG: hypothetical protein EAZ33_06490 [Oscillatoriales cyanobacterium]
MGRHGYKDNPEDWKRASALAAQMEADLDHPEWEKLFDPTLAKYGIGGGKYITVGEMWEAYLQWKETTIEETTFKVTFQTQFSNIIYGKIWNNQTKQHVQSDQSISDIRLSDGQNVMFAITNTTINRKTYFINELRLAFEYCKSKGMLVNPTTENPFVSDKFSAPAITTQQKYASKIVNGEEKQWHEVTDEKALEEDRRAFTKIECDIIIKAFYGSNKSHFAALVEFYFLTGCRTSEALALCWHDIDFERNLIRFNKSLGASTHKIKETKTGEARLFYFSDNSRLRELLIQLKGESLSNLCFPNKKGKYIPITSLQEAWRGFKKTRALADGTEKTYYYPGVVTQLVEEGVIGGYLPQYHTRHTYITLTAHANAHNNNALLHIATACGNSVDVILRHYLGVSESIQIVEAM